ncbi:hypothetical protein L873DRAFT_873706 [Choiromyces venosus 120613-1]|uniref:Uncharacterized protein n=1 Tax=Choiromyces venosus 120613-1 TaxID=1336337 RepID=A0A3N4K1B7_9PEZI|nr:hypothetical protein L873DRAFT_873639 [Choiromyces venosus 120613-1]RPA99698.1 hypothetical protein L873DRAFT_873706 [Choiromyces venosus 120613-1]
MAMLLRNVTDGRIREFCKTSAHAARENLKYPKQRPYSPPPGHQINHKIALECNEIASLSVSEYGNCGSLLR